MNGSHRVVLATWFPVRPESPNGGVEAVSVVFAQMLSRESGWDVHVLTLDPRVDQVVVEEWRGTTVHRLPRGGGSLLRFVTGGGAAMVRRYLLSLGADLVHAHDTFGMMTCGLPSARVFTIHGFIHEDTAHGKGPISRLRSVMWRRVETAAWAEQPHIISISPYVRERLRGIARGVIHDVENPVDERWFQIERREEPGVVLCAGAVCPRKNQLGLARAFAESGGTELVLAGPVTNAGYGEELRRFIRSNRLGGRIHIEEGMTSERLARECERCAVFALPSLEEGAPMAIAEAMAAGIPVVSSNRCGMPYMIRNGESGVLVDPCSGPELTACLNRMLGDGALRRTIGEAARLQARSTYHPLRVANRTLDVYNRCLRGSQDNLTRR